MYGLEVEETHAMFEHLEHENLFCHDMFDMRQLYLLPCFCTTDNDTTAEIIWVHRRVRRKGLATKLVTLLRIESEFEPLPGSLPFWEACGIPACKNDKK